VSTPLLVRVGHAEGVSFKVKHPGELANRRRVGANVIEGRVDAWESVGVLSSVAGRHRFVELEPDENADEQTFGLGETFFVRGRFRVVRKVNNATEADAAWRAFTAQ
jgi:hypothetical protein